MTELERLLRAPAHWFSGGGPRADEILSTRVRLARNLSGVPFVGRAGEEDLKGILRKVSETAAKLTPLKDALVSSVGELSVLDRHFLLERHLVTPDLTTEARHRGVVVAPDETLSIMINEEDHYRLQALKSGLQLDETYDSARGLDDLMAGDLRVAFDSELGFLTSCPTNVGTGMRASVLAHLPSLVLTQRIKKVLAGVSQVGLTVRGFHGEGSDVVGNFFQISNQVTLGISEEATLDKLRGVILQILDMESKAREALLRDARIQVEDKVGRALGTLRHAKILSSQETMGLLSAVRFGVTIGLHNLPNLATLNEVLLYSQPAHVQKLAGRELSSAERNEYRAAWIQERLMSKGESERSDA